LSKHISKMSTINNVAVVGGSGNLGPSIVHALLDAGFTVTVLTRVDSSAKLDFPATVRIVKTNYTPASLEKALKGQDAVISTIATAALAHQKDVVDAAIQAGVQRFIPSQFGIKADNLDPDSGPAKILGKKIELQKVLQKASEKNENFSWTAVSTGMFFDFGLKLGFIGFLPSTKTATIYDSGNEPFTGTNLPTIGKAIASVLLNPSKFANCYLSIASFITTQNEILKNFEEETGEKWTVNRVATDESQKTADEKLAKGDYSAFSDYLKVFLYRDGKGQSPKKENLANEELGLPVEDLKATVKGALN